MARPTNDGMPANAGFKKCPFCSEEIREKAVKCRFCGEWLENISDTQAGAKQQNGQSSEPDQVHAGQEPIKQIVVTTPEQEPSSSSVSFSSVETAASQPGRTKQDAQGLGAIWPLLLIAFWIFGNVVPLAIKNGASGAQGILIGIVVYCTTPGSIVLLPLLGIWFWNARRKRPFIATLFELARPGVPLLLVIVGCLGLIAFSYSEIHAALESRDAAWQQKLKTAGVNTDALKDWEIVKGAGQRTLDARSGFSAATKKKMRETFALSLMGEVGSVPNAKVELQGAEHDKLVFSSSQLSPESASNLPVVLRTADADFWNRMKFLGFSEVTFSGSNCYESIPAAKFVSWQTNYNGFVSNMVAMYDSGFSAGKSPTGDSSELNPTMQKTMRQNFASVLKGAFGAIYKAMDVRLEGENEDKLVIWIKEMDVTTANELLKGLNNSKGRNFGNALRAMAFQELTFKGDNYNVSYSKTNFVDWCYDYENYLSELHKAAGQISGAVKNQ